MHSLMYHDVLTDLANPDGSGFAGHDAAIYKLASEEFDRHLDDLSKTMTSPPLAICEPFSHDKLSTPSSWSLTFDDGGVSAFPCVADALEGRGWRGHFFITTERIGTPGFLSREQILQLHQRGHIIGSHSHTHPPRISALSPGEIAEEWKSSIQILREIVDSEISVASVPGGFFSKEVGKAASDAGIRYLYTSEPVSRIEQLDNCLLLGRYSVKHNTSAHQVSALASGAFFPVASMRFQWSLRGIAKRLFGQVYLDVRKALLRKQAS